MNHTRFAVLGAGPIGLDAAARLYLAGVPTRLFERGDAGAHIRRWAHVRMFSPWRFNVSAAGLRLLGVTLADLEGGDSERCPTGREYVERYLDPLADRLRSICTFDCEVLGVSRAGLWKGDAIGDPARATHPFRLLLRQSSGVESAHHADIVLDATGVYGQPGALGDGGVPCPGEASATAFVEHDIFDTSRDASRAGKRLLIIGRGHSAATSAVAAAELLQSAPGTRVTWVVRSSREQLYEANPDDPLAERARLGGAANALLTAPPAGFEVCFDTVIDSMRVDAGAVRVELRDRSCATKSTVTVDRIFAHTGCMPDRDLYRELQVHECYATSGPMALAAQLLGAGSADCLAQPVQGVELLRNPEPNFFIVGSKSYGRQAAFLMRTGFEQVETVLAELGVDPPGTLDSPAAARNGAASGAARGAAATVDRGESLAADRGESLAADRAPAAPFGELHTLWFQVTGLHCNLACTHCLVDSNPENRTLDYLTLGDVRTALADAEGLGVKEIYFTGGEPFLNGELLPMIEASLAVAPTTVLTNGTLIDDDVADRLAELDRAALYSLEMRLSLDDVDAQVNDAIRGPGVLQRVGRCVERLAERGMLPILTATEIVTDREAMATIGAGSVPGDASAGDSLAGDALAGDAAAGDASAGDSSAGDVSAGDVAAGDAATGRDGATGSGARPGGNGSLYGRFRRFLVEHGVDRPRVKIMPVFRTGRLAGLSAPAALTPAHLAGFDFALLQCHTGRVVAADGVYACPILAGQAVARLGPPGELAASFGAAALTHPACVTCYETGMTCADT